MLYEAFIEGSKDICCWAALFIGFCFGLVFWGTILILCF
jgi:hypothetical protein